MKWSKTFVSLILSFCFTMTYAAKNTHLLMGNYLPSGSESYPLFISSTDQGLTWKATPLNQIYLPQGYQFGSLAHHSCFGSLCLASGLFFTEGEQTTGVLLKSKNQGKTWEPLTYLPFEDVAQGYNDVYCSAGFCLGSGRVKIKNTSFNSFLMMSLDQGNSWFTWSQEAYKAMPIKNNQPWGSVLNQLFCTSDTCFALGNYWLGSAKNFGFPLLLKASRPVSDQEQKIQDWSFEPISHVPSDNIVLQTVHCSAQACVIGGIDAAHDNKPLILSSQQNGSWSVVDKIKDAPNSMIFASTNASNCNGNDCILIGAYKAHVHGDLLPFIFRSPDGGKTWSFMTTIPDLPRSPGISFTALSCIQDDCIIQGHYKIISADQKIIYRPIILKSTDRGASWKGIKTIRNLPADYLNIKFYSIDCQEQSCVSIGQYESNDLYQYWLPLIMTSSDKGETWTFIAHKDITNLPDFTSADLLNITHF